LGYFLFHFGILLRRTEPLNPLKRARWAGLNGRQAMAVNVIKTRILAKGRAVFALKNKFGLCINFGYN
jgi:hypothetical protein